MVDGFDSNSTCFLGRLRLGRTGSQVAQQQYAPFTDDLFRYLVHCADDTADSAGLGVIWYRAVRDRPVSFLHESLSIHFEENVVHPGRFTTVKWHFNERADGVPDFRPTFACRLAHRTRVLGSERGPGCIVVYLTELRTPPQEHLEPIGVFDQSIERTSAPISPPPARKPLSVLSSLIPDNLTHP